MKTNRSIEGIYRLPDHKIFVLGWVSAIIDEKDFGGVEIVPATKLASPHLGTNGDDKWYVFSPNNLIQLVNPPTTEELAQAEKLTAPTVH